MKICTHQNGWLFLANKGPDRLGYGRFISLLTYLKSIYASSLDHYESQPVYTFNTTESNLNTSIKIFLGH